MKRIILLWLLCGSVFCRAQLTFTISSSTGTSLTCSYPQLTLTASSNYSAPVSYTWSGPAFLMVSASVVISNPGTYTVNALSGTVSASQVLSISVNTVAPVSTGSTTFQVTGTGPMVYTFTAISPTMNVTHIIYTPMGGTFVTSGMTTVFVPGGPGIYIHCLVNDENGCSSCPPNIVEQTYHPPGSSGNYVGLDEQKAEQEFLFPNPTKGQFRIVLKNNSSATLEIYNSLGMLVKSVPVKNEETIVDLGQEPSGVYFVKIPGREGQYRYVKVLKE